MSLQAAFCSLQKISLGEDATFCTAITSKPLYFRPQNQPLCHLFVIYILKRKTFPKLNRIIVRSLLVIRIEIFFAF